MGRGRLASQLREPVERLSLVERTADVFSELDAIRTVESALKDVLSVTMKPSQEAFRQLLRAAWLYLFEDYYALERLRAKQA